MLDNKHFMLFLLANWFCWNVDEKLLENGCAQLRLDPHSILSHCNIHTHTHPLHVTCNGTKLNLTRKPHTNSLWQFHCDGKAFSFIPESSLSHFIASGSPQLFSPDFNILIISCNDDFSRRLFRYPFCILIRLK